MEPDAVDWNAVLAGAAWFHVTGITPALGANGRRGHAPRRSPPPRRAGVRVSVDLNYRKKLWTEAQAQAVMGPLMRDVDVVIANEEDLQSVLGVHGARHRRHQRAAQPRRLPRRPPSRSPATSAPQTVAITLRESLSASDNGWSAVLWDGDDRHAASAASATTSGSSIGSAAATASPAG